MKKTVNTKNPKKMLKLVEEQSSSSELGIKGEEHVNIADSDDEELTDDTKVQSAQVGEEDDEMPKVADIDEDIDIEIVDEEAALVMNLTNQLQLNLMKNLRSQQTKQKDATKVVTSEKTMKKSTWKKFLRNLKMNRL